MCFSTSCLRALSGDGKTPFDAWLEPRWASENEAEAAVSKVGDLRAVVSDAFEPLENVKLAKRGDIIALLSNRGVAGLAFGVMDSSGGWFARAPLGLTRVPVSRVHVAWRVP